MKKEKKEKKNRVHGLRFILSMITIGFVIAGLAAYTVGATYFAYYQDFNPDILTVAAGGAILCAVSAVLADKKTSVLIPSLLSIAASVLFAASTMMIINARVYSFAVLMLSDLERDNLDGYYALYSSIGGAGLITVGILIHFVTVFFHGYKKIVVVDAEGVEV